MKLIVFDWDGTLFNSIDVITQVTLEAFKQVGLPEISENDAKHIIGLGVVSGIKEIHPKITDEEMKKLAVKFRSLYNENENSIQYFTGAEKLLQTLIKNNFNLAIATGKSRNGLEKSLSRLNAHKYFLASRCADETNAKPAPDMVLEILESTNNKAEDAIVVGDTLFDIEMAHAANVKAIAVTYGAHSKEKLIKANPEYLADSLDDVTKIILNSRT